MKLALSRSPDAGGPGLGWREWVRLPDFGLPPIKAKIDSGARTSALHATNFEYFEAGGREMIRFTVHPHQHNNRDSVVCVAPLYERRLVRSSNGERSYRPVIRTTLEIGTRRLEIDLTLVDRERMRFRLLIGRTAVRGHFVIDPGASFVTGTPGSPRRNQRGELPRGDAPA